MTKRFTRYKHRFTSKWLWVFTLFLFPTISFALTIGTITAKPSKKYKRYRALASYLEKKLGEEVKVRFAKDISHMQKLMKEGEIDVFIDSLYPSLKVCVTGVCKPTLLRWKDGVKYYRSLIFTRADSDINSVEELVGKRLALDEPVSTSGYFVPVAFLLERGFKLIRLMSQLDSVPKGHIGYVFAGEEENVVGWVFFRRVEAGAVGHTKFERIVKDKRGSFKVIYKSPKIPRQLVNFSTRLDKEKADRLLKLLTSMHEDEEGKKALKKFKRTKKFEVLPEKDRELIEFFNEKILTFGL